MWTSLIILTKNSFMCKICFYELIHDYFLSVIIMQIVLFERMEISNFCSHSVHACETLWSDSNRADRKDFPKINDAGPADPLSTLGTHDTPARGPIWTFNGRVVVFSARANRVCSELLVESFLSALLESDQSVSASMHRMRTDV